MEETPQQERQESEYKNPNEDQGGIRRRLRDRDLLRKRKAEQEEKETNQVESQRKRSRPEDKSSTKKRGRPRKTEATPQLSVVQEEAAGTQEAAAVVVVPEPAEVIPDQISGLLAVASQPASVLAAPAPLPVLESVQSPVFAPTLTSPAAVNPILDMTTGPVQASASASVPAADAVSVPVLSQDTVPAAAPVPPSAPPQVGMLYKESQGREALDPVLIEDLAPDEDEDVSPSQDQGADEDVNETLSISVPEQNKMYSIPTLSSAPLPQEYLPGN